MTRAAPHTGGIRSEMRIGHDARRGSAVSPMQGPWDTICEGQDMGRHLTGDDSRRGRLSLLRPVTIQCSRGRHTIRHDICGTRGEIRVTQNRMV